MDVLARDGVETGENGSGRNNKDTDRHPQNQIRKRRKQGENDPLEVNHGAVERVGWRTYLARELRKQIPFTDIKKIEQTD